jgi:hypothetical protein
MKTRSNNARWWACLVASVSLVVLGPPVAEAKEPTAAEKAEAKTRFTEGRKLLGEGKLAEATDAFRRAHDLAPTPVTRIELARALVSAGKLRDAHRLLSTVAEMPVTATETQKSKEARKEAAELAPQIAARIPRVTLVVTGATGEPEVAIDGEPVSKELLGGELQLDPGDHVAVAKDAVRSVEVTFTVVAEERRRVELLIPPAEKAPAPPSVTPPAKPIRKGPVSPPKPAKPSEDDGLTPIVPVAFTASGIGLLMGTITGAVALSQAGELKDNCPANACPPEFHDELDAHQALTVSSTVGFALAGAGAAVGAIAWIVDATNDDAPKGASVRARFFGTGFAVDGTW